MGKSERIPAEFQLIELSRATGWDYWTLASQPHRFLELLKLYLSTEGKVKEEQSRRERSQLQKAKNKGRRGR